MVWGVIGLNWKSNLIFINQKIDSEVKSFKSLPLLYFLFDIKVSYISIIFPTPEKIIYNIVEIVILESKTLDPYRTYFFPYIFNISKIF